MDISLKCPAFLAKHRGRGKNFLIIVGLIIGIGIGFWLFLDAGLKNAEAEIGIEEAKEPNRELGMVQENTVLPLVQPNNPEPNPEPEVIRKMKVVLTGYSSSIWETDETPFITAAGTDVRDGIIANNFLRFGTKIRIPELYGDKVFIVEDRMNEKKGKYQIDIWFSSYEEALNFGAQRTYIEILEG